MQIYIKNFAGTKIPHNVEPSDTILCIKKAMEEKEGVEASMLRFIYGGRVLVDEKTVSDEKLQPGDTINVILQLRGGF